MSGEALPKQERLESWKEIAAHINRDARTARRWEKLGLPVRRLPGTRPGVYALVSEIDAWMNKGVGGHPGADTSAEPSSSLASVKHRRSWWVIAATGSLAAIAALITVWADPVVPRLRGHVEVTHDGWLKRPLIRRGTALFYQSRGPATQGDEIRQISESGDRFLAALPPGWGFRLLDVSSDVSKVLFLKLVGGHCVGELWEIPLPTAAPRRIGNLCATAAAWSPDSTKLAYATGRALYLAQADGTAAAKLVMLPYDLASDLRWGSKGHRLALALSDVDDRHRRLWEFDIDRRSAVPLLPGWSHEDADEEIDGQWTIDGRFFVFNASHNGSQGIWALPESRAFGRWLARPTLLANIANASDVTPGAYGNKIFAIAYPPRRGEIFGLGPRTSRFALDPKWAWLSGGQTAFSPDGQRVAYLSYPEQLLEVADVDGKHLRRLTQGADRGALPQWSPDGQRIAFMSSRAGVDAPSRIRIVSAEGRNAVEPVPLPDWLGAPTWISDNLLVFGENGPQFPIPATCSLHTFDLTTGKLVDLPGTSGLWTARACPAGRYIAAQTTDKMRLMLYDRLTSKLVELFHSPEGELGDDPTWSRDGAYIYMDVPYARDPAVYRIRIDDRRVERVASLTGIQRVEESIGLWMGLAPDNSLLILRQVEGSEICSWEWAAP